MNYRPWQEVRLVTMTGEHVTTGVIPHFNEPPDVIVWGLRYFARPALIGGDGGDHLEYTEAFTAALVDAPPGAPG